jgi:hypothetical protein
MHRIFRTLARLLIFDLARLDADSADPLADYPDLPRETMRAYIDRTKPLADDEAVTVEINRRPPYGTVYRPYIPPRIYRN